tara:strand:+ start:1054 stop:1773 length:720 start_codon:yes stop_codon:yes gene_type:complete
MQKIKKIKIFIGLFYLILLLVFLYLFFSRYSFEEITTYKFIQSNREYLVNLKESKMLLLSTAFLFFGIVWVFLMGFGSPLVLMAGFIFDKWIGLLLSLTSLTIGATLLYIFANFFFKDLIREKFLNKFSNLESKFKKNEFLFFLIYRFIGGIPFQIANILPTLFDIKIKNYFFGTLIGLTPQVFIIASLGSGIDKVIKNNENIPNMLELLFSQEIYMPIIGFIFLVLITFVLKKIFFRN